ncbi:MAG: TetR/AcrR family transcriptional regulator [Jatrophihabitans sp.]|uniref:TetR/AcrR family transcriptional regulator n=1 Tax=Jatrophihabitans sp. TaxID=1932789 RepID=UPI003F81D418
MTSTQRGPRERMVFSAAQLIRRQGVTGTGIRDVVEHAAAPRGSVQHYFPGGKDQLVHEAVDWAGAYAGSRVQRYLDRAADPTPSGLFAALVKQWSDEFRADGYGAGCPLVATVADRVADDATRERVVSAFATWRRPVADALAGMGVPRRRAPALATLMISTLEGAIVLARAERSVTPLTTVVRELGPLLDAAVARRR